MNTIEADWPLTRIVSSFHDVDFSDLQLPMVCIFKQPKDFPDCYVARIYAVVDGEPVPTDMAMIADDLQGLYHGIPTRFTLCYPRDKADDPAVVETWV